MYLPRLAGPGSAVLAVVLSIVPTQVATSQVAGSVGGVVTVVSRPGRRLATAGVYPGRSVNLPVEHEISELDNVVVFLQRESAVPAPPMRAERL